MSERNDAIDVLIDMLHEDCDTKDRVSAASKLLDTEKLPRSTIDQAIAVLREVMNDKTAGGHRVVAAEKLKKYGAPREETVRDRQKMIAALSNAELDAIIKNHIQFDPLLD